MVGLEGSLFWGGLWTTTAAGGACVDRQSRRAGRPFRTDSYANFGATSVFLFQFQACTGTAIFCGMTLTTAAKRVAVPTSVLLALGT